MSCGTGVLLCELDAHVCKWPSVTLLGSKTCWTVGLIWVEGAVQGLPSVRSSLLDSVDQLYLFIGDTCLLGDYRVLWSCPIWGLSWDHQILKCLAHWDCFGCWVNQPCSLPHLLLRCCCSLRAQLHCQFPACLLVLGTREEEGLRDISHEVGECLSKLGTAFGLCLCDGNSVGNKMWRDMEIQTSCLVLS